MKPDLSPEGIAAARAALGVPDERIPRSVAIIMDGNGRWATSRNLPRSAGHEAGAKAVSPVVTMASQLGLQCLALYSFSIEKHLSATACKSRSEGISMASMCIHSSYGVTPTH